MRLNCNHLAGTIHFNIVTHAVSTGNRSPMNQTLPPLRIERITVSHIDLEDETFSLLPENVLSLSTRLRSSISRVGLLHPPIVKTKSSTAHQIIAGRQRLRHALAIQNDTSCPCFVVPDETSDSDCLVLALEDILATGDPTAVELAVFFNKIVATVPIEEAAEKFLSAAGRPANVYSIKQLLSLLQLESPILKAVHEGFMPESVARSLLPFSFADRLSLFETIAFLRLSVSNQKKIIAACTELSTRMNISVLSLLADEAVREILDHPETNVPQKAAHLMTILEQQRFPRLNRAEDEFRAFVSRLALPEYMSVKHSPSFEQDQVQLFITFKDRETLVDALPKITSSISD